MNYKPPVSGRLVRSFCADLTTRIVSGTAMYSPLSPRAQSRYVQGSVFFRLAAISRASLTLTTAATGLANGMHVLSWYVQFLHQDAVQFGVVLDLNRKSVPGLPCVLSGRGHAAYLLA